MEGLLFILSRTTRTRRSPAADRKFVTELPYTVATAASLYRDRNSSGTCQDCKPLFRKQSWAVVWAGVRSDILRSLALSRSAYPIRLVERLP